MGETKIPSRSDWKIVTGHQESILKDKQRLIFNHVLYMLNKTINIFEYGNLPEYLGQREIELYTQCYGFTIWKRVKDKMYVFYGGLGGIPNAYYLPTIAIVTNPFLQYYEQLKIDEDCVVMWNDSLHVGVMPIHEKYAHLLAENEISLRIATINARIPSIIEASTDTEKKDAEIYLEKVENGELAVFGTNKFLEQVTGGVDHVRDFNKNASSHIKDLIEENQYLYAKWWNEFGVNANYNMKREAINESEASMNVNALLPLIDDWYNNRKLALEKINKMFDLNITIDYSSAWKKLREDIEIAQKVEEAKEEPKQPTEDTPKVEEENKDE